MIERRPLCIDLYAGLGGWAEGFLAEGWEVVGFDIERHRYQRCISRQDGAVKRPGMNWSDRTKKGAAQAMFNRPPEIDMEGGWEEYPGQLVLQDVLTLHGSQFRDAACIVASPPCQAYSYMAMPWKRAKAKAEAIRADTTGESLARLNALFDACFRIQREASEAAGHHIPLVVENVKGAQPWVGPARWHWGSFYLWGDVPALMPMTLRTVKVNGFNFHEHEKTGRPGGSFQSASVAATKNSGGSWFAVAHNTESGHGQNPDGRKGPGGDWFKDGRQGQDACADGLKVPGIKLSARPDSRKAASAMIAKIPFPLARWIAQCYKPVMEFVR